MKLAGFDLGKGLDLGLLRTIETLLRAGKFNRVANLVAASEPVAVFALRKMREVVDDQLLVRTATGVVLTARARRLAEPLRDLLERIQEILAGRDIFDPAFCEETFTIAATDYATFVLTPGLAVALAAAAPRTQLAVISYAPDARKRLEGGTIDLVVGAALRGRSTKLRHERLFAERFACVARSGHPRLGKRLTAKQYAEESHVTIRPGDPAIARADPSLADPGRKRHSRVTVPHFLFVPEIVARTELLATLPERVAEQFAKRYDIAVLNSPVRPAGFSVAMTWHERTDADPARAWLRSIATEVAGGL